MKIQINDQQEERKRGEFLVGTSGRIGFRLSAMRLLTQGFTVSIGGNDIRSGIYSQDL